MEKIKNLFESYKGLIIFYIIVALLAFLLTKKIEEINSQAEITEVRETYYA
jgi:hypothetical protein